MNVKITARKFKAHETLREYAEQEVKSLERYFDSIISAEVILYFEKVKDSIKTAEIIVSTTGKKIAAKETSEEFQKSIDLAVSKLRRQLEKLKTRVISTKRTARKKVELLPK